MFGGRGSFRGAMFTAGGFSFAHRVPAQLDTVGVMHQPIQDAIGDGGIADLLVPLGNG
jgi:hypothetical protein